MPEFPPITIVIHELHPYGGQERATYELVRRLLERGAKVTVIARRCEQLPASKQLRWIRIRGPSRPAVVSDQWFFLLGTIATAIYGRGFRHAVGAIVLNRVDAATVQFCHAGFSSRPTAGGRRSRATIFHAWNAYLASALARLAERVCYRPSRARRLVAVSAGIAEELRRFFPRMANRVSVIPNGVDRDRFHPDAEARARMRSAKGLQDDDLVAVFLGGDWERKGLPIAIEGMAKTKPWHLLVGGQGDAEALRDFATRQNAGTRVHLCGPEEQARPAEILAAGDAFLFPSSYEGFSLASLEATATGLPLLISRINGSGELVTNGETGFLIDRTPESIERALEALADDPDLRRRMGERNREASARYGWDSVAREYEALYLGVDASRA